MRAWLVVNLFFCGIVAAAAAILFAGTAAIRAAGVEPDTERQLIGLLAIAAVVAPLWIARTAIRRFERRR